jgi:serine/threonine protein kinase
LSPSSLVTPMGCCLAKADVPRVSLNRATPKSEQMPAATADVEAKLRDDSYDQWCKELCDAGPSLSFGDFEVGRKLGHPGGERPFSMVVLVRKRNTTETYALRVQLIEKAAHIFTVAEAKMETHILKDIRHPFLVRMHFAFHGVPSVDSCRQSVPQHVARWADGKPCLCIGLGHGEALFHRLKSDGTFPIECVKLYAAEIGVALGHLHAHEIVWLGGKYSVYSMENVLLDESGHVLLSGFRHSRRVRAPDYLVDLEAEDRRTRGVSDPPLVNDCIAPEIYQGHRHGKSVDWWWLGALVFEMLTGLPPFYASNCNHMIEKIMKAELSFPPSFPAEAKTLVEGLLNRDPSVRLGAGPGDLKELEAHTFFADLDFAKVERKEYTPVYAPTIDETFWWLSDQSEERTNKNTK